MFSPVHSCHYFNIPLKTAVDASGITTLLRFRIKLCPNRNNPIILVKAPRGILSKTAYLL
jgi:hypothetical protein